MKGTIRADIEEVMDRTMRFHASDQPGQALIEVSAPPPERPRPPAAPYRELNEWSFPDELPLFMGQTLAAKEREWKNREGLPDDRIPAIFPRFGIVEHYAFLGNEIEFGKGTSWGHPVLTDWNQLPSLEYREDRPIFQMLMDGYDYLIAKGGDRFVPCLRGLMCPMDIANAVRGNDLFLDFYEHPEEVKQLLSFCAEAGKWFVAHQKDKVGSFCDGTMCGGGAWLPGNSVGHLSEDASVMCSPQTYEEFGLPYTVDVLEGFDYAFVHLHGAGDQAFKAVLSIDKITCVEITNDPNQPRSIEFYRQYFDLLRNRAVKLFVTPDEIRENIDLLKKGKSILWTSTKTQKEGADLVAYVRDQLPAKP